MMNGRQIFDTRQQFKVAATSTPGRLATLVGYAIVWNVLSSDRGGYRVRCLPNSARFATPTFALYGHDFKDVVGKTSNGTLRITPDSYGVRVEIDMPNTTCGRDLLVSVRDRDVDGMSFSMVNGPEKSDERIEGGQKIIDVSSFLVDEVTITAIPAFRETTIATAPPATAASYDASRDPHLWLQKLRAMQLPPERNEMRPARRLSSDPRIAYQQLQACRLPPP